MLMTGVSLFTAVLLDWVFGALFWFMVAGGAGVVFYRMVNTLIPDGGCALFQWIRTPHAVQMHDYLARQGILVRCFTDPSSLRFGLPGNQRAWERLNFVLARMAAKFRLLEGVD